MVRRRGQATTAFIGATSNQQTGTFYVTLNSFHHFITHWADVDIAKALSLHLFDLTLGLVMKDTSLTMLKMFGDDN
jgi:hypothetical protein